MEVLRSAYIINKVALKGSVNYHVYFVSFITPGMDILDIYSVVSVTLIVVNRAILRRQNHHLQLLEP